MFDVVKLNLENSIVYDESNETFDSLAREIYKREAGFEALLLYSYEFGDTLKIERIKSGIGLLGREATKKEDSLILEKGVYLFQQQPILENEVALERSFLSLSALTQSKTFYVRLVKESALECVMQLFIPC